MEQAIVPGKKIDVVTPAELKELLQSELRSTPQRPITAPASGLTDVGGNMLLDIYEVPAGMEFELAWLLLEWSDSAQPQQVPRAMTNAWAAVLRSGTPFDYLYSDDPAAANTFRLVLPQRFGFSTGEAHRLANGTLLSVRLAGWAQNNRITATVGGRLFDKPRGN